MLNWLAQRRNRKRTAQNLYGSIVALSRQPELYSEIGVPDSVEGRFEILVVHMFLLLDRLERDGEKSKPLAQALVDEFFSDMDTTTRELGVGDLSVPKKIRRLVAIFSQRLHAYRAAIDAARTDQLSDLLAHNLELKNNGEGDSAVQLATYMRQSLKKLAQQPVADVITGMASGAALAPVRRSTRVGS